MEGGKAVPAPVSKRAAGWARHKILKSAADDMVTTERLMRVANFFDPPKRLLKPAFLGHAAAHHIRQGLTMRRFTRSNNY